MATLATLTRNAACNAVVDLIDRGTPPGYLRFLASSGTVAAQLTFNSPAAFGSAATGQASMLTASAVQDTDANATETVATAAIYSAAGTAVMTGITCSTSGAEINLSSLSVAIHDTVTLSSLTVTMPAS